MTETQLRQRFPRFALCRTTPFSIGKIWSYKSGMLGVMYKDRGRVAYFIPEQVELIDKSVVLNTSK
jgi:hypothetical protein